MTRLRTTKNGTELTSAQRSSRIRLRVSTSFILKTFFFVIARPLLTDYTLGSFNGRTVTLGMTQKTFHVRAQINRFGLISGALCACALFSQTIAAQTPGLSQSSPSARNNSANTLVNDLPSNMTQKNVPGVTSTLPSDTDPGITQFNDPHLSWLPYTKPRNELLVFVLGTNGKPRRLPFLETAAQLGYHVISLMYPCDVAAQQVCPNSDDPNAYMNFRLEIIQGQDLSNAISVSRTDSIENRLRKLIKYLTIHQPGQGWDQYMDNFGEPKWSKIGFAGQSQGGGHAYVISKVHEVARVMMFGSPKDYSHYFNAPARGFDSNTKTPLDRYFAFNHMEDKIGLCNHEQQMEIFRQMGLLALGSADADHPQPSYNHAHLIFTDGQMPDMSEMVHIHNFALNNSTVISSNGQPICPPVWKYMLTEPVK
ncbi:unnamed protein product [Sphagnum balticum]